MIPQRLMDGVEGLLNPLGLQNPASFLKLKGDASTREYYRVSVSQKTFMAMLLPEQKMGYGAEEITKTSRPVSELPFVDVQAYLLGRGVLVPKIHGYDRNRGVLLLDDFGDLLLLHFADTASHDQIRKAYEMALDQLSKLAPLPEDARSQSSILFARRFDADLYNLEFEHFLEYGLDKNLKTPLSPSNRCTLVQELEKLTAAYLTYDPVVCHRDYHSRNLLVLDPQEGSMRIGVIDFQDALLAPLFYDLASLLRDSYITLDPALQNHLLEYYRDRIQSFGFERTQSRDEFRKAFDFMGLHRNLKAAGRFCFFSIEKGNKAYLPDVPRTLAYVQTTLDTYDELRLLNRLLKGPLQEVSEACRS